MHGLIIGVEPISQILCRQKIWEIRGKKTSIRGKIALIKTGTKTVVGTAEIVTVHGPLSLEEQRRQADKHLPAPEQFKRGCYPHTYAWELKNVKRLRKPVPYKHPSGAVIWVMLPDKSAQVRTSGEERDEDPQNGLSSCFWSLCSCLANQRRGNSKLGVGALFFLRTG